MSRKWLVFAFVVAAVAPPVLMRAQFEPRWKRRMEERKAAKEARKEEAENEGGQVIRAAPDSLVSQYIALTMNGGRLDWSGSRNQIVFDRLNEQRFYRVWVMNPDGSGQRCITCEAPALPNKHEGNPAWHPSAQFIAFQAQNSYRGLGRITDFFANPGSGVNNDIWIMDSEGRQYWQVTHVADRTGGTLHPHFSPNGKWLIWAERTGSGGGKYGTWVIRLASFSVQDGSPRVGDIRTLNPGKAYFYETHGFGPDSETIYFSANLEGQSETGIDLYSMNLQTGKVTNLTKTPNEWDEHAQLSPDGRYIVWMTNREIGATTDPSEIKSDFWIMRTDGAEQRRVTYFNDPNHPEYIKGGAACGDSSWAPDGRRFAAYAITSIKQLEGRDIRVDLKAQY